MTAHSAAVTAPRPAAVEAAMARFERRIAHQFSAAQAHKVIAREILSALRDGRRMPTAALDELAWSLPQEIRPALACVSIRLSLERAALRRKDAGAWFIKVPMTEIWALGQMRLALRWLRRHEFQAMAECAE